MLTNILKLRSLLLTHNQKGSFRRHRSLMQLNSSDYLDYLPHSLHVRRRLARRRHWHMGHLRDDLAMGTSESQK